jgi:hypothetical protein
MSLCLTGACFKFPCGRWLGRGVDDGSLERYLVAGPVAGVPGPDQLRDLVRDCAGPPAVTSPPLSLRSTGINGIPFLPKALARLVGLFSGCFFSSSFLSRIVSQDQDGIESDTGFFRKVEIRERRGAFLFVNFFQLCWKNITEWPPIKVGGETVLQLLWIVGNTLSSVHTGTAQ